MASLGSGDDAEPFALRDLAAFYDRADPGAVDCHGFFGEHMLAGLNGGPQVRRTELRWPGQDHVVYLRKREQVLAGIETYETVVLGNVHLRLLQLRAA